MNTLKTDHWYLLFGWLYINTWSELEKGGFQFLHLIERLWIFLSNGVISKYVILICKEYRLINYFVFPGMTSFILMVALLVLFFPVRLTLSLETTTNGTSITNQSLSNATSKVVGKFEFCQSVIISGHYYFLYYAKVRLYSLQPTPFCNQLYPGKSKKTLSQQKFLVQSWFNRNCFWNWIRK